MPTQKFHFLVIACILLPLWRPFLTAISISRRTETDGDEDFDWIVVFQEQ